MSNKQVTVSQFFSTPATNNFLEQQLGKRKGEFISNVIALTDADKALQKCDPADLMKCAMNATALNLPLNKNLGYAYVIPYNNRKTGKSEPQFQMGYKGFIQLAIRSGQYKTINACEVREGEIRRNKFTGAIDFIGEYPDNKIIGYLAYVQMLNGFEQSLYMSVEQVEAHAKKYSQNYAKYGTGLWKDEFDLMALKTVLKLLLNRYGVLSTEMQLAQTIDQTNANGDYIDNKPRAVVDAEIIEQGEPEAEQQIDEQDEPEGTVNLEDL